MSRLKYTNQKSTTTSTIIKEARTRQDKEASDGVEPQASYNTKTLDFSMTNLRNSRMNSQITCTLTTGASGKKICV